MQNLNLDQVCNGWVFCAYGWVQFIVGPKEEKKLKGGKSWLPFWFVCVIENLNQLKRCIFTCHIHCKLCKFKMLSMQLKLCKKNVDWCKDQGALANELLYRESLLFGLWGWGIALWLLMDGYLCCCWGGRCWIIIPADR